ncbi:MAG TPA: peptidylprolyl isomerase [Allosphingosinicella sp.]|nr:peptidylprolyl isomerase [Allosphingosinicella sp.]
MLLAGSAAAQRIFPAAPPPLDPENTLLLDLSSGGRVTIQLRPEAAPNHVERVKELARKHFYDGLTFHRVIEGFMAQGGDPKGDGTGGSDLPDLKAEFNGLPHVRGAVAAARAENPDSANSQFYIMLAPRLTLDGTYTVFGRVVAGMNFVDAIERGEPPMVPTKILRASVAADNVPPPAATAPK